MSRNLFKWKKMPDFVVGGAAFDNWLVADVVHSGRALVVDITRTATVVHQDHDKGRKCGSKCSLMTPKSTYNSQLAKKNGGTARGTTLDAPYATVRTHAGVQVLQRDRFYV